MAKLIAHNPPIVRLKSSGFMGEPTGEIELTENHTTYNVKPYASAKVDVPDPVLIEKEITENGTYKASEDNADGFSEVNVNLPFEQKTVTPSTEQQIVTVTPNTDYQALSKVTVLPAPLESKTVPSSTEQVTYTPEAPAIGFSSVTVEGADLKIDASKPVEFIDYDGELLYTYTRAEALALTELPPAPTREGLTFQTWNWSLQGIKDYLAHHSFVIVGAVYTSSDGENHDYWDNPRFEGNTSYISSQKLAEVSSSIVDSKYLKKINIPNETQSLIRGYGFWNRTSLKAAVVPFGCSLSNYAFSNTRVSRVSLAGNSALLIRAFQSASELKRISIPDAVVDFGTSTFYECVNLKDVELSRNMSAIKDTQFYKTAIQKIVVPASVLDIEWGAFLNCSLLTDIVILGKPAMQAAAAFGDLDSNYLIYVHSDDLSWFSTATNWSAIYEDHIVAIEDNIQELLAIGIDVSIYE